MIAELLQGHFSPFWRLQNSCKDTFPHFGVCRTSARTLFPILAFAGVLQGRLSPFWRLQNFCKGAFPHFGLCRTSARTLFPILAFAAFLQGRFSPFWTLQNFCKDAFPHFGVCRSSCKHNKSPTRAFTRLCRGFFLKVGQILSLSNPPTPEGPPYRGTPYTSMLTSRSPYARNRP